MERAKIKNKGSFGPRSSRETTATFLSFRADVAVKSAKRCSSLNSIGMSVGYDYWADLAISVALIDDMLTTSVGLSFLATRVIFLHKCWLSMTLSRISRGNEYDDMRTACGQPILTLLASSDQPSCSA